MTRQRKERDTRHQGGPHDDSGGRWGDGSTNLREPRTANPRNRKRLKDLPLTPDFRLLASRTMR